MLKLSWSVALSCLLGSILLPGCSPSDLRRAPRRATLAETLDSAKLYARRNVTLLQRDISAGPPADRFIDGVPRRRIDPVSGPNLPPNPLGLPKVLVVIRNDFYPSVKAGIDQYLQDLSADGYLPKLIQLEPQNLTAAAVKTVLLDEYDDGALEGAVFVGALPVAMYEDDVCYGPRTFPCDFYFMDLISDGPWLDTDGNGIFDVAPASGGWATREAEIWVSRMHTTALQREDGAKSDADDAAMINAYLARNHAFRTGPYNQQLDGNVVVFKEDDFVELPPNQSHSVHLYRNDRIDFMLGYDQTTAAGLSTKLAEDIDWFCGVIHGNEALLSFKTGLVNSSPSLTTDQLRGSSPQPYFVMLDSCGPGRFTALNYLAGWFLFGFDDAQPRGLAVMAHTDTLITKHPLSMAPLKRMVDGKSIGHAWRLGGFSDDEATLTRVLLGDGALRPAKAVSPEARKPADGSDPQPIKLIATDDPSFKPQPTLPANAKPDLEALDIVFKYFDASETTVSNSGNVEGLPQKLDSGKWLGIQALVQYHGGGKGDVFIGQYADPPLPSTGLIGMSVSVSKAGGSPTATDQGDYAKSLHFGKPTPPLAGKHRAVGAPTMAVPLDGQTYTVTIQLDPNNLIDESDETNNAITATIVANADALKPDFAMLDAGLYTGTFEVGLGSLKKTVTVFTSMQMLMQNRGTVPATEKHMAYLYSQAIGDGFFTTNPTTSAPGHATRHIAGPWFLRWMVLSSKQATGQPQPSTGIMNAVINPPSEPDAADELSTTNNALQVTIPLTVPPTSN